MRTRPRIVSQIRTSVTRYVSSSQRRTGPRRPDELDESSMAARSRCQPRRRPSLRRLNPHLRRRPRASQAAVVHRATQAPLRRQTVWLSPQLRRQGCASRGWPRPTTRESSDTTSICPARRSPRPQPCPGRSLALPVGPDITSALQRGTARGIPLPSPRHMDRRPRVCRRRHHRLPAHQLPAHQLPAHQLPAHQLPAHQLPAHQLPAQRDP
jgi:hypothetical protein